MTDWQNIDAWAQAAADERYYWDIDSYYIYKIQEGISDEIIWDIVKQYDTLRTFPTKNRGKFCDEFRRVADKIVQVGENDPFGAFVETCLHLADFVKKNLISENGATRRPLSGVSKLLWHRHPERGFIYDSKAFTTLSSAELLGTHENGFLPERGVNGEKKFLKFAAGYRKYFFPLHQPIAQALADIGRDPLRASRVVDKLLWNTRGGFSPSGEDREIAEAAVEAVRATELGEKPHKHI